MRTIRIKAYKFDELSKEAKETAINHLQDINVNYDWWESTYEDALNIGLKITSFDLDRNRHATGEFITPPAEVVETILADHGPDCETYKTALRYKNSFQLNSDETDESELEDTEDEFLKDILEDYSIMLQHECEYLQTDEAIAETLQANDYEFTKEGKLI